MGKKILGATLQLQRIAALAYNPYFADLEREYLGLELAKMPINKAKTEALASVRTQWLPDEDSNLEPSG